MPLAGEETVPGLKSKEMGGYRPNYRANQQTGTRPLPKNPQQGHLAKYVHVRSHPCSQTRFSENPQREVRRPFIRFLKLHHAMFLVKTIPPLLPPSDAVNKRGHTTAPSSSLLLSAPSTRQLAHKSRTPSSASGCTTIAKTASTPPAPGTPAQSTPGRTDVASTRLVWTGGSIGTPASCQKKKAEERQEVALAIACTRARKRKALGW